jgi:hypothetical protein
MNTSREGQPGFWRTVSLLLGAARKRSEGRRRRQQQLLNNRSDGKGTDLGGFAIVLFVVFMFFLNGIAAFVLQSAVESAQRVEIEQQGKIVVSLEFFQFAAQPADAYRSSSRAPYLSFESFESELFSSEAKRISEKYGGSKQAIEQKLRYAVHERGGANLVPDVNANMSLNALSRTGPLPAMLGSLILLWWVVMLAFQGEGLEMDTQRRRHPIWEWLFSHPVQPGAIFLAEMLSPIAANPIYWGGPLFAGFVYGFAYGPALGLLAAPLVGVPLTVAAACLGKALEIAVILRFSPRSRGAIIGLMSWLGYSSMMLFVVGVAFVPQFVTAAARFFELFTAIPWPWLSLFLGSQSDGSFSFLSGLLACWIAAGLIVAAAVWFSAWGAQKGLSGNFASDAPRPSGASWPGARFGKRAALSQGVPVVHQRPQRHCSDHPGADLRRGTSGLQPARPPGPCAGRLELPLRRGRHLFRYLLSLDSRPEIAAVGRDRAVDRAHLAARP